MQSFLPHPNFEDSLRCLDVKRLGKQRVEAKQMVDALRWHNLSDEDKRAQGTTGWVNHPAVLMWRGYTHALMRYHNMAIHLWVERGYKNTMPLYVVKQNYETEMPPWFGDDRFHASHRSALLFKNAEWYGQFGWSEPAEYNYFWPPESQK